MAAPACALALAFLAILTQLAMVAEPAAAVAVQPARQLHVTLAELASTVNATDCVAQCSNGKKARVRLKRFRVKDHYSSIEYDDLVLRARSGITKNDGRTTISAGYRLAKKDDMSTGTWYDTDCEKFSSDTCNDLLVPPLSVDVKESGVQLDDFFSVWHDCESETKTTATASRTGWEYELEYSRHLCDPCGKHGKWSQNCNLCLCDAGYEGNDCTERTPCGAEKPHGCTACHLEGGERPVCTGKCINTHFHLVDGECRCNRRRFLTDQCEEHNCSPGYTGKHCMSCDGSALEMDAAPVSGSEDRKACALCPAALVTGARCPVSPAEPWQTSCSGATVGAASSPKAACLCDKACATSRFKGLEAAIVKHLAAETRSAAEVVGGAAPSFEDVAAEAVLVAADANTKSGNTASALAAKMAEFVRSGLDPFGYPRNGILAKHPRPNGGSGDGPLKELAARARHSEVRRAFGAVISGLASVHDSIGDIAGGHLAEATRLRDLRVKLSVKLRESLMVVVKAVAATYQKADSTQAMEAFFAAMRRRMEDLKRQVQEAKNAAVMQAVVASVEIGLSVAAIVGTGGAAAPLVAARLAATRAARSVITKRGAKQLLNATVKKTKRGKKALDKLSKELTEDENAMADDFLDGAAAAVDLYNAVDGYHEQKERLLQQMDDVDKHMEEMRLFFKKNKAGLTPSKCPSDGSTEGRDALCKLAESGSMDENELSRKSDGCSLLHLSIMCMVHDDSSADAASRAGDSGEAVRRKRLEESLVRGISSIPLLSLAAEDVDTLPRVLGGLMACGGDKACEASQAKLESDWTKLKSVLKLAVEQLHEYNRVRLEMLDHDIRAAAWAEARDAVESNAIKGSSAKASHANRAEGLELVRDAAELFRRMFYYQGFSAAVRSEYLATLRADGVGSVVKKLSKQGTSKMGKCESFRFTTSAEQVLQALQAGHGGAGAGGGQHSVSVRVAFDGAERAAASCSSAFYGFKALSGSAYIVGARPRGAESGAKMSVVVSRDENQFVVDADRKVHHFELYATDTETRPDATSGMGRPRIVPQRYTFQTGYAVAASEPGPVSSDAYLAGVAPAAIEHYTVPEFLPPTAVGDWTITVGPDVDASAASELVFELKVAWLVDSAAASSHGGCVNDKALPLTATLRVDGVDAALDLGKGTCKERDVNMNGKLIAQGIGATGPTHAMWRKSMLSFPANEDGTRRSLSPTMSPLDVKKSMRHGEHAARTGMA